MSAAPTTEQTVPLHQLRLSPKNTRQRRDPEAIDAMAASILHHGLLQNLIVEPATNDPGVFEVLAGGTRLVALQRLQSEGKVPADHPVRVLVETNGQAIEASAAENLVRTRLAPADEFDAFKALADAGKSRDEIAQHFGVARIVVDRSLKLANVSPQLFQIFREGGMELDQLRALALTDDHELQHQAWFGVKHDWERMEHNIRSRITSRDVRASSAVAQFVGIEAYEAAGGAVRRDLFDERNTWLCDRQLLESLAMDRLEAKAQALRDEGWSWVEAHLSLDYSELNAYPKGFPDDLAETRPLPETDQRKLAEARARIAEIEAIDVDEIDDPARKAALNGELDDLQELVDDLESRQEQALTWPTHVMERSGCLVRIDHFRGQMLVEYARLQPGQKIATDGKVAGTPDKASKGADAGKRAALSRAMEDRLHMHHRAALRDALTNDHGLALELLLTHLLTALLDPGSTSQRVFAIRLDNPHRTDTHGKSVELADVVSSPASQAVDAKLKALKSKLPKKAADIQAWVATKSVDELHELLALVAAATLDPTKDQARALAQLTKLDMREFWKPDAEHYLNHVPKSLAAEAVAEVHGKAAGEKVAAMKKNEAIAEAAKLLAGSGWLPKPLRGPGYKLAKPGTAAKAAQNKAKAPAAPAKQKPVTAPAKKKPAAKKAPAKQPAKKPKKSKAKA